MIILDLRYTGRVVRGKSLQISQPGLQHWKSSNDWVFGNLPKNCSLSYLTVLGLICHPRIPSMYNQSSKSSTIRSRRLAGDLLHSSNGRGNQPYHQLDCDSNSRPSIRPIRLGLSLKTIRFSPNYLVELPWCLKENSKIRKKPAELHNS
jgi:hypothetical protein